MPRKNRRSIRELPMFPGEESAPPAFASTPDEIKLAVERGAKQRGELLIRLMINIDVEDMLRTIDGLAFDREDVAARSTVLGIDKEALKQLDEADPPLPYTRYFCLPEHICEHPNLIFYYRNAAMLSLKVMNGIKLSTTRYEQNGQHPSSEKANEIANYFNRIVSVFINSTCVSPNRHLEIVFSNFGDSLGGASRNEVGRVANAQIIRWLLTDLHKRGQLFSIQFSLNSSFR